MSKTSKNYFPTPNEIFSLGLSPGEFAVYSYLLCCANRRTHQCWPSYKTIGTATQMSVNTVRKHVCALADKGLISTEDTTVFTRTGLKHNGSLLYTIRPFQEVLESHNQSQLRSLEVQTAKWEYAKTASFHHFTRWLSQVVFRDFAGIGAGVIFHPLGASRGSVFPLSLQPPQNRRVKAGIFANFRRSIMPREKSSPHRKSLPVQILRRKTKNKSPRKK